MCKRVGKRWSAVGTNCRVEEVLKDLAHAPAAISERMLQVPGVGNQMLQILRQVARPMPVLDCHIEGLPYDSPAHRALLLELSTASAPNTC